MIRTKYKKLCVKAIQKQLTHDEKLDFDRWLNLKPDHQKYFSSIENTWKHFTYPEIAAIDVEDRWQQFESRYDLDSAPIPAHLKYKTVPAVIKIRFGLPKWTPVLGAAMAAIIFILIGIQQHWIIKQAPVQMQHATQMQIEHVLLSDGTVVHLNHESRIEYQQPFSDTLRQVQLYGEAYFEVQPGNIPFEVITDYAAIRVLGTKFNVWNRHAKTRVMVTEGCVNLANVSRPDQGVIMHRGQMSQVIEQSNPSAVFTFSNDSAAYVPGWMHGYLEFYRTPLGDIAGELERTYNAKIIIADSVLTNRSVTAVYYHEPLDTILASLALTLNMQINRDGEDYILKLVK